MAKEQGMVLKTLQKQRKNAAAESAGLDRSPQMLTESPFLNCGLGEARVKEFLLSLLKCRIFLLFI